MQNEITFYQDEWVPSCSEFPEETKVPKEIKKEETDEYTNMVLERIDEIKPMLSGLVKEMGELQKIIKDKFGSLTEKTQIGNFYIIPTVITRKSHIVEGKTYTQLRTKRRELCC